MNQQAQLVEFHRIVDTLIHNPQELGRRRHLRSVRSISLRIQPLDHHFHPQGPPIWVISRDFSWTGLGFISAEPIPHDFLKIGLLEQDVTVIGQVRHCTSIGDHYPLFLVGVEFLVGTEPL